eukprot:scaffold5127_cov64-Phaeocystis_antarctica.AAC.13
MRRPPVDPPQGTGPVRPLALPTVPMVECFLAALLLPTTTTRSSLARSSLVLPPAVTPIASQPDSGAQGLFGPPIKGRLGAAVLSGNQA